MRQRAQAALDSNDDAKIAAFVATGHDAADLADKQDALNAAQQAKLIPSRWSPTVATRCRSSARPRWTVRTRWSSPSSTTPGTRRPASRTRTRSSRSPTRSRPGPRRSPT
nr:ALF repeat-containing protein [Actinoplanes sp. SE50/110]